MTVGRNDDIAYSILLLVPVLLFTNTGADPLYGDAWYYLGIPVVMLLPGMILRAPPLFFTGSTAAAISSLLVYVIIQYSLPRPDGLLALGHLFSMSGMLVGTSASAWLLRYRMKASLPWLVAGIAFLGATLGFMIAQMITCNTVFYCGVLTFVV